ncbi:hypothetical protein ADIARSV_3264 [Arcticibacter svalbardensis MN12-7]|uniref:Uncharacterized protein n=1 Tax=Arcticibacter svalbardensis MN12-7 TaxID=1150600 RepID=R9GPA6_9SPHI|nr:hypothetical protein ADIARSV_3264 [Arcticibacter svalbardensis MN12-7]
MTTKVKNSTGFAKLEMFARSNGRTLLCSVKEENASWKQLVSQIYQSEGER